MFVWNNPFFKTFLHRGIYSFTGLCIGRFGLGIIYQRPLDPGELKDTLEKAGKNG